VFANAGYDVTRITNQDILDHNLNTGNYDVLILADNVPRENATDLVREFWLGGGGILSFDSGAGFLGYAGILPREDLGVDDGAPTYWNYDWEDGANVSSIHPVTIDYVNGTNLSFPFADWAQYDWSQLMTTSISSSLTMLAADEDDANGAVALAMDPTDMGGRVVQLGIPVKDWQVAWEDMMIDAVEWLAPRPKGRILFDLTHNAYYGVDSWEDDVINIADRYSQWRNGLVNKSYTFDKLWPSASGNLTAQNLQGYDMLIVVMPNKNFTSAEVSAVTDWVNAGGSLLALGDQASFNTQRENMNYLLNNFGLEWNTTNTSN
jgi:hypothetical protein